MTYDSCATGNFVLIILWKNEISQSFEHLSQGMAVKPFRRAAVLLDVGMKKYVTIFDLFCSSEYCQVVDDRGKSETGLG